MENREQKILDIMMETILTVRSNPHFRGASNDQIAEYIRVQLNKNGVRVQAMGLSHAILI